MSRLRRLLDRAVPRGALLLSVLSLGYFAAGIVRNRVFAAEFGISAELDAYNAAFRIPEIALDVLVGAGLSAPFVPIFTRLLQGGGTADSAAPPDAGAKRATAFGQTVLTAAVAAMAIVLVILFIGAPWLADTVWSGFDAPTRALYVELVRINCLAQLLFAGSMALGEVLVARRRFLAYGIAPILYTSGIVAGSVLLGPSLGILGAAWGAVVGAGAHLAARSIGAVRTGFRIRPRLDLRTAEFREFFRLMLPRMVSYPIDPIQTAYFAALALTFGPGSASALTFADDYRAVPVILIAQQFSLALFPSLSAADADGDRRGFRSLLSRNVLAIGVLTLIAAVLLAVLAPALIGFLLRGGAFDAQDVALTASLLAAFAVSVPLDGLTYPLSRGLYATHNTVLQVIASIAGFVTIVAVSQALAGPLGIFAIPAAYAAGSGVKVALLAVFLTWRLRRVEAAGGPSTGPS
jgi:putative peptidoglycan lipid II flippase